MEVGWEIGRDENKNVHLHGAMLVMIFLAGSVAEGISGKGNSRVKGTAV